MKQALLRRGSVTIEAVPEPMLGPKDVLVEVARSLISIGTEASSVRSSSATLVEKIKSKPGAIKKGVTSVLNRGLRKTWEQVKQQMDGSTALGYSCAGRVLAVGSEVEKFAIGDLVACAGAGLANHAELVSVPVSLCVPVPSGVSTRAACFVTLGAIALQGVRRADVRLGETVCVLGLGLIGQLTVQLLAASGCKVIGMDLDAARVKLARAHGLSIGATSSAEISQTVLLETGLKGVDATILTASTSSSEPTQLAFELTRKKGKIVVVGAVGLNLQRSPFYEKEQDFLISCSYGPGRYDVAYEKEAKDYPYAYVRWTENRNMQAFLELIRSGSVDVESLIDKEIDLDQVTETYESLQGTGAKPLAVVIKYPESEVRKVRVRTEPPKSSHQQRSGIIRLALIGAGSFLKSTHLPNLERMTDKVKIVGLCTGSGASASTMARQLNVDLVSNDYREIIRSPDVDAVLVCTRHNNHAEIARAALDAGKHVYLEKPIALTAAELAALDLTVGGLRSVPTLMVGFNRRYSPFAATLKEKLTTRIAPLFINYRVNAGMLPENHWTQTTEGGGRLRGEACHMIDLFRFLVGQPLEQCDVQALPCVKGLRPDENFTARFRYADGSLCVLNYYAIGNPELAKEWAELHWDRKSAVLRDFEQLELYGCAGSSKLAKQDKGHSTALETFFRAIAAGESFPIPWEQLYETTQSTIELDQAVWGRMPVLNNVPHEDQGANND
jgi:predicted dehydrogenase/threonine dehydrogenase-like Zn-dependent dehydrogenase